MDGVCTAVQGSSSPSGWGSTGGPSTPLNPSLTPLPHSSFDFLVRTARRAGAQWGWFLFWNKQLFFLISSLLVFTGKLGTFSPFVVDIGLTKGKMIFVRGETSKGFPESSEMPVALCPMNP